MSGPNLTGEAFGSIPPGGGARRTRRLLAGGFAVLTLLGMGIAGLAGAFGSSAPDRSDPVSTATVFAQRYATGDPTVCDLVTEKLATALRRDGRCAGTATGTTPRIDVLVSHTCRNRHRFQAEVDPPGEIGTQYLSLWLIEVAGQWSVRDLHPISDRNLISDSECRKPSSEYWGG